jgi:DNA-binding transcriptional ArsR family regulator
MTDNSNWAVEPDPARDLLLDTRTLQALSHPVRARIQQLLRDGGPSTATRLARQLGLNSGATSYHLRCLAAAGLITEDGERGDGRDRWWQAAHRSTFYDPAQAPPAQREVSAAYLSAVAALYAERTQRSVDELASLPPDWLDAWTISDYRLHLTAAQSAALLAELMEVIGRYRPYDPDGPAAAEPGAEQVILQLQSFVLPGTLTAGQAT